MSESVKLGKVSMTLGGDYSSSQAYDKLTCVQYDGRSWVSRKQVPAGVAPTEANSAYWQKISERGVQGPQGQSYVDKELVPIVNDLTTGGSSNVLSAEQGKVLDDKVAKLSMEIGSEIVVYDSEILVNQGLIDTNGKIYTSESAYAYSNRYNVAEGQLLTVTVNQSAGVAAIVIYDKNGNFVRSAVGNAYLPTTITITIQEGESSVCFCSAKSGFNVFSASFSAIGVKSELAEINSTLDKTIESITDISAVIGEENIEYNSSILVNQGLIASNGTIYTSSDYAAYSYSNPIKVKKGQRISVTVNQTAGAAAATLFDADDKPIRTLIPTAYVVATAETEIEDGVAYVRFCSANSTSSVFKAVVEGGGFAKDLKQIQSAIDATNEQVAELGLSVENINEKLLEFEQRKVGDFYQTAWVRASDGYISYSSGGAMTYIIYRDDIASATEVYARVCTENVIFAPIAFYSGVTPSTSNFISALNGVTDKNLHDFVGVIPEGCKSILVMNMSQYQADYDIRVNESEFVTRQELKGEEGIKDTTPIFNPFAVKNQYYHFNQENVASETFIPAQSLYDIRLAAQLGFEWIEANAWPCSDGVFITKHGSGGAFGNGLKSDNGVDYTNVQINSVSSTDVRNHITYDSRIAKYNSPIPTLEEFCAECKKYNMGVKTNNQSGLLAVMRKYLTDDKIFISNMVRGDFKGLLEVVYYPNEGYEKLEEKCNQTGYPLQVIIASGYFDTMTDDAVKAVVEWCHIRNYTVAVPYLSSMNWMRAQRLGVDVNLSCERTINPFLVGNDKNIRSLSDSGIALSGSASYNADTDTIVMAKNSILTIAADNIRFGAVSADICYKGMVTIEIGHSKGIHSFVDIASDGNNVFSAAQAILPQNGEETTDFYIKIYAKEDNTIIKDLNVRCSKL